MLSALFWMSVGGAIVYACPRVVSAVRLVLKKVQESINKL